MGNGIRQNSITVSREEVQRRGGLVILPLKEYHKLRERAVPTYYLTGKEAKELDKLVTRGLEEYEKGETIEASSVREALKIYGGRQKRKKS